MKFNHFTGRLNNTNHSDDIEMRCSMGQLASVMAIGVLMLVMGGCGSTLGRTGLESGQAVRLEQTTSSVAAQTDLAARAAVKPKLGAMVLPFIANQGQSDERVKFYATTFAGTVFVTGTGELVYALPRDVGPRPRHAAAHRRDQRSLDFPSQSMGGVTITEALTGARVTEVRGEDATPTRVNVFHGNAPDRWQRQIPTYRRVSLGEVYEGIELALQTHGHTVEKRFQVRAGAAPERIRIKVGGGRRLDVTAQGELAVETEHGSVRFSVPVAYQEVGGTRQAVDVAYAVEGDEYGFRLGAYDRSQALVIDPILSTFLGRIGGDAIAALALDGTGNVYVAGVTSSPDFPGVDSGSADSSFAGNHEGFVAKLDGTLSTILAATFLGGSNTDSAQALALDGTGNVYVAGVTLSADFPGVDGGSADSSFAGGEVFVAKLDGTLSTIWAATFLGGSS
ncbi:MAG: SBBP repeat-containing protein, partial [Candidatus Rokuibacteriota bacterium]